MKILTLSDLINQSYKLFNTYGKTEVDIQEAIPGFMEVLQHYHVDQIVSGFKVWLDESSTLPTPSDIKRMIIKNKPLGPYTPPEGRTIFPTDQEIENVGKMVQDLKDERDEAKKSSKGDRCKQDYTHFNRASPEQQAALKEGMRNMVKQ